MMLRLRRGRVSLEIAPERGGGILAFRYGEQPLFCDVRGEAPTDLACVALLPFANRIANGRFLVDGSLVGLPCLPGEAHALHGQGWLLPWKVEAVGADHASLSLKHEADEWPWQYDARQTFTLDANGYCQTVALTNRSDRAMPAGVGLHPWLPRTARTRLVGRHRGEWQTGPDKLPARFVDAGQAVDWWRGAPVATRLVDQCYAGRSDDLRIVWPERSLSLCITPSPELAFTHVYVPEDAEFFCVEPVSHMPDAVNRSGDTGLKWLAPGETLEVRVSFQVNRL